MAAQQRSDTMRSWYLASRVKRYHTWPVINEETVGQHSHGVATIYLRYFACRDVAEDLMAVRWALAHDLSELWTGDLPFPVKKRYPALASALDAPESDAMQALDVSRPPLRNVTFKRLKVCDLLQMHLFGMHEVNMGNKYAVPIMRDTLTTAVELAAGDDDAVAAIERFKEDNRD